ncbi:hypothetical protein DL96DRAFT_1652316 [Flagelloscypha sp. PMI_526]|nr:hypothetical protein DL96DRAFT_1652316 [Flagelloscypha sp. PMI_526]
MPRGKRRKLWDTICDVSPTFLETVRDSADAFPPLKSVAGFFMSGHKIVERLALISDTRENMESKLAIIDQRIQDFFPAAVQLEDDLTARLNLCIHGLVQINTSLDSLKSFNLQPRLKQIVRLHRTESDLQKCSSQLTGIELEIFDIHTVNLQRTSSLVHDDIRLMSTTVQADLGALNRLVLSLKKQIIVFFHSGLTRGCMFISCS